MPRLLFVITAFALLLSSTLTQAAEPRWTGPFARPQMPPYSKHAQVAAYGKAVYPKYYWGLHAREFENVGIPHGDIGILGSGLTRNPW
jgi:hypothetical protein